MAFLWQIGIISSRSLLYLIGYNGSSAQQMLRGLDSRVWQGLMQADCRRAYVCRERVIGEPSFSDRTACAPARRVARSYPQARGSAVRPIGMNALAEAGRGVKI
jgi:hypothetical protein